MRPIDGDALIETIENHPTSVPCGVSLDISRGKMQMLKQVLDDIRNAPTVGGWISVKDRLPKLEESVLVYGVGRTDGCRNKHTIEISYRYLYRSHWQLPGEEVWAEPWDYFFVNYKITHWMPLPEPPKEETPDA